jgi:hypothetical protein
MNNTYGIGGTEVRLDANEAIQEISQNRTLLIEKLTSDPPVKPEIITGLKTVDDVFDYFKPEAEVEFEDQEGGNIKETLKFNTLADFGLKGITKQSSFLSDLTIQKEQYFKLIKVLKNSKVLKSVLANPETKQALINAIHGLVQELEQSDKNQ